MGKRNLSGAGPDIGQRIRERREYLNRQRRGGFTRVDAADYLGLSRSGYTFYENGRTEMRASDLYKLSLWLETSLEYLLGIDDQPEDWGRSVIHYLRMLSTPVRDIQVDNIRRLAETLAATS